MVEVSDNVLSSPTPPTPTPSQPSSAIRNGQPRPRRARRPNHIINQRNSPRISENNAQPQIRRGAQGDRGYSPPPPAAAFVGDPYRHLYHFYAHHGEFVTNFRMGSSIQYSAVDITHAAEGYEIRIWYQEP